MHASGMMEEGNMRERRSVEVVGFIKAFLHIDANLDLDKDSCFDLIHILTK